MSAGESLLVLPVSHAHLNFAYRTCLKLLLQIASTGVYLEARTNLRAALPETESGVAASELKMMLVTLLCHGE